MTHNEEDRDTFECLSAGTSDPEFVFLFAQLSKPEKKKRRSLEKEEPRETALPVLHQKMSYVLVH